MHNLLKLFKIFTPNQLKKCLVVFLLMVFGSILEAFGIGLILPLISMMGDPDFLITNQNVAKYASFFGIKTHLELIVFSTIGLLIFYIFKNFFIGIEYKIQIDYTMKFQSFFMDKLLESYLSKPYEFFLKTNPSVVQRNVLSCSQSVFSGLLIPFFQLSTEILTALFIGLMLFFVDPFTGTVLGLVMITVLYIMLKTFRKKVSYKGIEQTKYAEKMYKWTNQSIGAIKETKVLCKEGFFLRSFNEACSLYCSTLQSYNFINQLPRLFIETLAVVSLLGLILLKLSLGEKPIDIVPLMGLLALSAFRLMPCANRIIVTFNSIKFQLPNLDILFNELISIKNSQLSGKSLYKDKIENRIVFNNKIEIKNIEYSYPKDDNCIHRTDRKVLKNVSLVIQKGKFIGLVGQSGAGKTTFVDILLGLLKPTSGNIFVDDVDIYSDIRGWQSNLAYVPQTIYLIDGSIKENIAFGQKTDEIDDIMVRKVLDMAELSSFVNELPEGIDTNVGDRGVRLSGGQRQRIGIARALYTNPDVLILDEATSALDSETEKNIMKTILKLKGKITIISIAHRISTLNECDYKIQFKNGMAEVV